MLIGELNLLGEFAIAPSKFLIHSNSARVTRNPGATVKTRPNRNWNGSLQRVEPTQLQIELRNINQMSEANRNWYESYRKPQLLEQM
jgi:hypothetical protein